MVFFDGVESGEMLDFVGFARSGYRTQNGEKRVETSDMPFLATGKLLYNVIYPPIYTLIR